MRLSGQFQACFFFFHEKILSVKKKHQNAKQTIFTLWEAFVRTKNCCPCCFLFAYFCFVSWFLLVTCIFTLKNFSWKKNKQAWNCPGNLIYYTTEVHPYQPAYQEFICMHLFYLWSSARISFFLWESFWIVLICENIFFFMIICANPCFYKKISKCMNPII